MASCYFCRLLCVVMLVLISTLAMQGQSVEPSAFNPSYYYIDLNSSNGTNVVEISNEWLSLIYNDQYARAQAIELNVYDWRQNPIARFNLNKEFGLNYFNINAQSGLPGWSPGQLYRCELINEGHEKFTLFIKCVAPAVRPNPVVGITVNPVHVECGGISNSTVQFFGQVSGAQTPYVATWYVYNSLQTELLYQPYAEVILKPGITSTITVDAKIEFYVLLDVKDACGNRQTQTVRLACKTGDASVNTLFIEPVLPPPTSPLK